MRGFSKKKRSRSQPRHIDTVIGSEATFAGVLLTKNSICIEGGFKGQLKCESQVILNKSAIIEADIVAEYISIYGKVTGNITALKQLNIGMTGIVHGDVKTAAITVDKGGILDGTCKMLSEQQIKENRSSLATSANMLPNGKAVSRKNGTTRLDPQDSRDPKTNPTPQAQPEAVTAMAES